MRENNNIPLAPVVEEIIIEQTTEETITELREKLKNLQDELSETEEENEELNKLIWKGIEKLKKEKGEKEELKTRLNNFKTKLLGSLFKNKKEKKRIGELNNSLSFLRRLLTEKNQEVINLTTQINDLNRRLIIANNVLREWTDKFPGESAEQTSRNLREKENKIRDAEQKLSQSQNNYNGELQAKDRIINNERNRANQAENKVRDLEIQIANMRTRTPTPPRYYSPPRRQPSPPQDSNPKAFVLCQKCEKLVDPHSHSWECPGSFLIA